MAELNPLALMPAQHDFLQQWHGCRGSWTCPKCAILCVCDSSGKAGTRVGNTRYINGPCACGMAKCPECDYDGWATFFSPPAMPPKPVSKTCGNCRFWGRLRRKDGTEEVQQGEWRQCGRAAHDSRANCLNEAELLELYGDWADFNGNPIHNDYTRGVMASPIRQELAVVQDGSGYHAALKCRADFGCVLHEPS